MRTKKSREPSIDCVAMKRAVQAEISGEVRGMTHAEEIAHYERDVAHGPMEAFWRSIGIGTARPEPAARAKGGRRGHAAGRRR